MIFSECSMPIQALRQAAGVGGGGGWAVLGALLAGGLAMPAQGASAWLRLLATTGAGKSVANLTWLLSAACVL